MSETLMQPEVNTETWTALDRTMYSLYVTRANDVMSFESLAPVSSNIENPTLAHLNTELAPHDNSALDVLDAPSRWSARRWFKRRAAAETKASEAADGALEHGDIRTWADATAMEYDLQSQADALVADDEVQVLHGYTATGLPRRKPVEMLANDSNPNNLDTQENINARAFEVGAIAVLLHQQEDPMQAAGNYIHGYTYDTPAESAPQSLTGSVADAIAAHMANGNESGYIVRETRVPGQSTEAVADDEVGFDTRQYLQARRRLRSAGWSVPDRDGLAGHMDAFGESLQDQDQTWQRVGSVLIKGTELEQTPETEDSIQEVIDPARRPGRLRKIFRRAKEVLRRDQTEQTDTDDHAAHDLTIDTNRDLFTDSGLPERHGRSYRRRRNAAAFLAGATIVMGTTAYAQQHDTAMEALPQTATTMAPVEAVAAQQPRTSVEVSPHQAVHNLNVQSTLNSPEFKAYVQWAGTLKETQPVLEDMYTHQNVDVRNNPAGYDVVMNQGFTAYLNNVRIAEEAARQAALES